MRHKWSIFRGLFCLLSLSVLVAACTVESTEYTYVDDGGEPQTAKQVVTDTVWFDQAGRPHCPVCEPSVYARGDRASEVSEDGEAPEAHGTVADFQNRCSKGHTFHWNKQAAPCWRCDGAGVCGGCNGSGLNRTKSTEACPDCAIVHESGLTEPTGRCLSCGGHGIIQHGG